MGKGALASKREGSVGSEGEDNGRGRGGGNK